MVSRRWVGGIYGCGCKEVYSSIPAFVHLKKFFFVLIPVLFCN